MLFGVQDMTEQCAPFDQKQFVCRLYLNKTKGENRMIPVEKIAGGSIGNLLYYISIVGLLLVVATIIRLKVPFLRKAFIPASLIAGVFGLILGQ